MATCSINNHISITPLLFSVQDMINDGVEEGIGGVIQAQF